MVDAPVGGEGEGWLVDRMGRGFTLLTFAERGFAFERLPQRVTGLCVSGDGLARQRYDAQPGTSYLIRPDRYVAARWRRYDPAAVDAAVWRATGNG
jgi:3-(3-hydroxy-phenyl)propionate hydroxylase